ncbi:response regulator with CheY-like receiver domain and winged-helix DNA-binding domain [Sulfurospirillum barnesii SES-3]|uniref:Response regulator with CheY-like receiver domain and winged-helix DNA-binding domain n=1 Tax=Sulfurospirillum barnesii (strain ATCC 700032 / DSM 10660 / SES-3) TaxID=760154 RepID=I3XW79_SULBS|nr:response regulator transcription factor [Sulfurospirillum barnesii]AFL68203.1 response regulator with CheY-like receiver domain and winged-helix DNA-binding domain [Sulfurospirillum barnesii SES-3]
MKILLLEDNVSLAEIIQEMLEEKGYKIDWFEEGEEALFHSANGYDCFILDINVPNVNGLELLKEIRSREKKTPAIIISANIELETIQKAYGMGCNDFLKKPFYMYELERKIELLCSGLELMLLADGFSYELQEELLYDAKKNVVKLTPKESRFMRLLAKTPNKLVTIDAIEQYVWEGDEVSLSGIRSLVKRLRTKLSEKSIETQSYGYALLTL